MAIFIGVVAWRYELVPLLSDGAQYKHSRNGGMLIKLSTSQVNAFEVRVLSGDSPEGHLISEQAARESPGATGRSWLFQQAHGRGFRRADFMSASAGRFTPRCRRAVRGAGRLAPSDNYVLLRRPRSFRRLSARSPIVSRSLSPLSNGLAGRCRKQ